MRILYTTIAIFAMLAVMSSCKKEKSAVTGWKYNDKKNGGFEVRKYKGQETGPNLVLIEGGTFVMGNVEQDVTYEYHSIPRRVTVSSFYMDETEVKNVDYREYLYWLTRVFGADYPEVVRGARQDTLVWREEMAYNEPFVEYYHRHPAYNNYPVVGVSWLQANDFCTWRSDRVNEEILIDKGVLKQNPQQFGEDNFNTEAYLLGQYEGIVKKNLKDLNPNGAGRRKVKFTDGILLPSYRLPTEAEWEFAALALIGNQTDEEEERVSDRKLYPWNGSTTTRFAKRNKWHGDFLANYKRGRGDNMGMAGALNDNASITAPVWEYMPNDYGLYNMAGNVSEWVMDVYRPMTFSDDEDFNPFRGNVFKQKVLDEEQLPVEKDSLGRIRYETQKDEDLVNRRNYKKGYAINHVDGDEASEVTYDYGVSTLINDKARVFKGGSWNDRAYFLSPGTRRHLQEFMSTSDIGFRCAMIRIGGQSDSKKFRDGLGKRFKASKKAKRKNARMRKKRR